MTAKMFGVDGLRAALAKPEEWECFESMSKRWVPFSEWKYWDYSSLSNETRSWRRRPQGQAERVVMKCAVTEEIASAQYWCRSWSNAKHELELERKSHEETKRELASLRASIRNQARSILEVIDEHD
jgi:hypothetical protein